MIYGKDIDSDGMKHPDYALVAALALWHFGTAELLGMSKRRLPEFLEEVVGYKEIVILGISLSGDAERLAKALAALKGKDVRGLWLSGFDFPEWMGEDIRGNLVSYISPLESVSEATAGTTSWTVPNWLRLSTRRTPWGRNTWNF